jgi:chemotaxis protein MotB
MAGQGKQLQPIIVKRVKKAGHSAHGGAWKIAYADFVTAMMAFFLLMWLLGSTAKGDLQGIAEYFQSPLKVTLMGGDGTGNSDSILPGGGRDLSKNSGQVDGGDAEKAQAVMGAQLARANERRQDRIRLEQLQQKMTSLISQNPKLAEFKSQIRIDTVNDGLQIQIVDEQNRPMFDVGSALVKPYMRDILREIGGALGDIENRVTLSGHTDATPYGSGDRGYSNWELSADRANASRRELVAGGMPDNKLLRVQGMAASDPLEPDSPGSAVNRRISVIVMTREAEDRIRQSFTNPPPTSAGPPIGPGGGLPPADTTMPVRPRGGGGLSVTPMSPR